MRKLAIYTLILSTSYFTPTEAQENKIRQQKYKFHELSFQTGFSINYRSNEKISDFNSLAPLSSLLKSDLASYTTFIPSSTELFMASVAIGIELSNKQYILDPLFRVEYAFVTGANLQANLDRTEYTRFDTLVSNQTGHPVFLDSSRTESFFLNYRSKHSGINGSIIIRTNPQKGVILYTGLGVGISLTSFGNTEIWYSQTDGFAYIDPHKQDTSSNYYNAKKTHLEQRVFKNKTGLGFSTFIPIGMEFRLGKGEFGKHVHLFYEARIGFNTASIPELRMITKLVSQHGFGIKFSP